MTKKISELIMGSSCHLPRHCQHRVTDYVEGKAVVVPLKSTVQCKEEEDSGLQVEEDIAAINLLYPHFHYADF
jgi:hypothetical protein